MFEKNEKFRKAKCIGVRREMRLDVILGSIENPRMLIGILSLSQWGAIGGLSAG